MNQFFTGVLVLSLSAVLWGLGRKPKISMNRGTEISAPSSKIPLILDNHDLQLDEQTFILKGNLSENLEFFTNPQNKINLKRKLLKMIDLGPEERLKSVQIAAQWGDSSVLPIIKRGLRDSDTRVVALAAKAMDSNKFRSYVNLLK